MATRGNGANDWHWEYSDRRSASLHKKLLDDWYCCLIKYAAMEKVVKDRVECP